MTMSRVRVFIDTQTPFGCFHWFKIDASEGVVLIVWRR